ncbi:tyrosine-type recombinase/integrase [Thalassobaculum sp.]|uniref:tyrosine-type recombinase/integrase n=1 Tax=Thalassobaculum sp. TaxID=2022740 RepID=UPI003B5BCE0F
MSNIHSLMTLAAIFDRLLDAETRSAVTAELARLEQGASVDTLSDTTAGLLRSLDRLPAGLAGRFAAESCTLADAIAVVDIAKATGLSVAGLERCIADARRLAKHLLKSTAGLSSLPVARGALYQRIQRIGAAGLGMTPKSFASFRARILRLARILDRRIAKVVLPQVWADLVAAARATGHGHNVAQAYCLIRTAARLNLLPVDVDPLLVSTTLEEAVQRGLDKPHRMIARACAGWNALAQSAPGWPDIVLVAPARPEAAIAKRKFFKDLPPAVQTLWNAFEDRHRRFKGTAAGGMPQTEPADKNRFLALLDQDLEQSVPRYAAATLAAYRGAWLQLAHLALEDGASITTVGDVLSIDRCSRLLVLTEDAQIGRASRTGEDHLPKNSSLASQATAMIALARATHSDPALIAALLRMRAAVDPMVDRMVLDPETCQPRSVYIKSRRRTGPRHRRVIEQFQGEGADAVKAAFFRLPQQLMRPILSRIRAGLPLTRTEQVDAIVALTCRILMECPMRRANLAGSLRICGDRQTLFLPSTRKRPARLHVPAIETKTERTDVVAEFSPETTELLRLFITHVRPQVAKRVGAATDNCWLFPGEGQSPRSGWCFSTTLKARAEKIAGITINPHAFRHVVGLLILEQDPNQLPLVSTLLGHASLRTTTEWYAEIPQKEAHEAYLHKLSSVAAKAALAASKGRKGRK